jgi:8-oxo-dGTP pyrophosphatase MutT (NUDIX family)
LFEKHKKGFFFPVGGRIKIGESSEEAAIRELLEETGISFAKEDLKFLSVLEYFFFEDKPVHEINFIYEVETDKIPEGEGLVILKLEEMDNLTVYPPIIKLIISNPKLHSQNVHIVNDLDS